MNVLEIAHHRNGQYGLPYYSVIFEETVDGAPAHFLGIVFEQQATVAVIDINRLKAFGIGFGDSSWCGERYENELRNAIAAYNNRETVKDEES